MATTERRPAACQLIERQQLRIQRAINSHVHDMATTFNGLAMQRRISHRGSEHQCIDCSQQVRTLDRAGVANIDDDYRSPICLECRYGEPSKLPAAPTTPMVTSLITEPDGPFPDGT